MAERLSSVNPAAGKPATHFKLAGDAVAACELMSRELARFKSAVDEEAKKKPPPKEGKVFTLWLYPPGTSPGQMGSAGPPVALHLPWANRDRLRALVLAEVESLYARQGTAGVREVLPSLEHARHSYAAFGQSAYYTLRNAVPFKSAAEANAASDSVSDACRTALQALDTRKAVAVKSTERVAGTLALGRLADARREIDREIARYFTGKRVPWLPEPVRLYELEGPGVRDLLFALRDIHRARSVLERVTRPYQEQRARNLRQVLYGTPAGGPRTFTGPEWFTDADEMMEKAYPQLVADLRRATEDLALALLVYGRRHPVLFRIWNWPELAPGIRAHPTQPRLEPDTVKDQRELDGLELRLKATLNGVFTANSAFARTIGNSPAAVWRYPPLVQAALDQLGYTFPGVEYQAAQERVAAEQGTRAALSGLSMAVGAMDALVGMACTLPWLGVALAVASLVIGGADVFLEASVLAEQEQAFKAVLDPSKALAVEPDYSGLVLGLAFSLLDMKGVRDALGAAKLAADVRVAEAALAVMAP